MKTQNSPISEQLHSICSNGIFRPEQLQIGDAGPCNHRYLIVSCGGIGAKVLHRTKQLLKKHFSDSQLSQHVRFLAVDTDDSTPFQTIISHTGIFT